MSSPDLLNINQPEISFYGQEVAWMIEDGLKLVTLRVIDGPDKYEDLVAGQKCFAACRDDKKNIPSEILYSDVLPINKIPVPVMG